MACPTYTSRVIVLRKTKLGESDLILTMLAEDGSQLRAVAKGARKPKSSFASRLELFSVAEVLIARGKSLDIVSEAQLICGNAPLRADIALAAAAAPCAELLDRTTQLSLESPRLFDMTRTAFSAMAASDAGRVCSLTAAHLLKTFAFSGFRPTLDRCAVCGGEAPSSPDGTVAFSPREGGVICSACRSRVEAFRVDSRAVSWAHFFLGSTFRDVAASSAGPTEAFSVLDLCQRWTREHVGHRLKSLDFLFTCGLY